jgi:DNA-binding winged helix-turn-helix (wHTH) protein/tetratricopeptide (TPR) repeat protein
VQVRFDRFQLDEANASLLRDNMPVALAPTPFAVLCALVRKPRSLLTKDALLDEVWGHQFVSESVLKTVISELRTVLGDDARHPRYIETVSRRGYRFVAATTRVSAAFSPSEAEIESRSLKASTFVGRAEAIARLRFAWKEACGGKRAIVWVAGEAGIGKTTLIENFLGGLGDAACARGQCVEQYGSGEPYLPVLDALADLCHRDSTVAPLLRAVAPAWLLQLPWLSGAEEREALRRELVGVGPDRMLREMGEFFDRYTVERPLLLVTEDLHWSDQATIQLINHVARRRTRARLMWIGSYRLAEIIANDHPLKALRNELRLHGLCEEVVLDAFSEQEVADYVAQRAPSVAADETFVRALHQRTDGLPLFVAYVMKEIAERAAEGGIGSASALLEKMAMPENLVAVIDHYVEKLGPEQRTLLSAAAVCGVEFRARTLAHALGGDAASVDKACGELAHDQLWLVGPRTADGGDAPNLPYSFRHALVRQVLYDRTGPLARAEMHARVGRALEAERAAGISVAPAELATHFERGRKPMIAMSYFAEAAKAAFDHLSPTECVALTERGLALMGQAPEGDERKTLEITLTTLHGLSDAHLRGVSSEETKAAFQHAYRLLGEIPQHPKRSLLLHGFGFVLCMRAEYEEALALARRAEELSTAEHDPLLLLSACTVHGEVHMLMGRPRAALEWVERGLAIIDALDTKGPAQRYLADPRVTLLGLLAMQELHLGLVLRARAHLEEAYKRARQLGQPMAQLVANWFYALFEIRLGNVEHVASLADEMHGLVDSFALAQGRAASRWFRAWADARKGAPREAHRRIREAYEDNTRLGMLAGGSETLGYAAEALLLAGDLDEARDEVDEALEIARGRGERVYLPQLLLIEGALAQALGQSGVAQSSVRRAVEEARTQEAPWLELTALTALCEREPVAAEDREALAALVDRLPEAAETTLVSRARALLKGAEQI